MPDPRVPTTLARRHREALDRVAASFSCPQERLLDEAVEHYLRRLGVSAAGSADAAAAGEPDPAPGPGLDARRAAAAWTATLR